MQVIKTKKVKRENKMSAEAPAPTPSDNGRYSDIAQRGHELSELSNSVDLLGSHIETGDALGAFSVGGTVMLETTRLNLLPDHTATRSKSEFPKRS